MTRVHRIQSAATNDRVGYCLDVVDIFLSKAVAARHKDRVFCIALLEHNYVATAQALTVLDRMPLNDDHKRKLRATIRRWAKAANDGHPVPTDL
jgi:hypothetical protein